MKTIRLVLWVLVAAMAVALGWLTYEWQRTENELAGKPYGVPFELVDQNGEPITEAAFRGRPTAVFFGFTHCPEICPTTLFELDGWLGRSIRKAAISAPISSPSTPSATRRNCWRSYVSGVTDRIIGISGEPDDVRRRYQGVQHLRQESAYDAADPDGDYTMDHTASVFLLDSQGRFKGTIAWGENPDIAITKLENLLKP
jgi:protein SCO1/2